MNEGLLSAFDSLEAFREMLEGVRGGKRVAAYGMSEGQLPFTAAALFSRAAKPVAYIAPTEFRAAKVAQDVCAILGEKAAMLPARELQFSRAASSRESTWKRIEVLGRMAMGQLRFVAMSAEALADPCVEASVFRQAIVRLEEGGRIQPEKLIEKLIRIGYERVPMVEGKGQCAMRGAILDVFSPADANATRLEFFDDILDSVRQFDCISQRSVGRAKAVTILPATECLLPEADAKPAALRMRAALEEGWLLAGEEQPDPADAWAEHPDIALLPPLPPLSELDDGDDDGFSLPSFDDILFEGGRGSKGGGKGNGKSDGKGSGNSGGIGAKSALKAKGKESKAERADAGSAVSASSAARGGVTPTDSLALQDARWRDDADRVEAGIPFRTAQTWIRVLASRVESAMDYLDAPIAILEEPHSLKQKTLSTLDALATEYQAAARRGDAFPAQKEQLFTYEETLLSLKRHPLVAFTDIRRDLGGIAPDLVLGMEGVGVTPYQSQMRTLAADVKNWREQGYQIALLAGGDTRAQRLQDTLASLSIPSTLAESLSGNLIAGEVLILPAQISRGFVMESAKLVLVADSDIYEAGYHKAGARKKAGERIASFTDLHAGDFVVHESHGVGVFKGIIPLSSEGVTRDYLLIQYADGDKLYVPTDQFDRVQRFIGSEQEAPKLNRLGGGEWSRQKAKVKAGLKAMAFDLAKLYARRQLQTGYAFSHETPWQREFEDDFPYELTPDQKASLREIYRDMESNTNMDRLLCGDVGYGKTEVALRAAFKAVMDGKQVALLAPTTILVQQHYHTILKRFGGFPIRLEMLSRFRSPKEQKEIIQRLNDGDLDMVVGTHRLLAKDVKFKDLGLLIVDEEHRFGVAHKEAIKNLKTRVDVLTLSATPIPRTLHMSMVGIRDMSLLETPPEERYPVKTYVVEYDDMQVRDALLRELNRGGQVYFLYNRVSSIDAFAARLRTLVPQARVCVAHGQMRESALEDIMTAFYAGSYDVLLCTTIIESGLDVPDANTLIVFDAERFGLSQLYQIRGRVGRSNRQAYAYFTVRKDKMLSETAAKRLSAIREFTEFGAGHRIAMRDLEIRGAGNVLGAEQHGQLSTIGYDMYVKLMEQTIREVQGETAQDSEFDTRVELRLDAFLPADYVPDERQRIEIYKRIAMIDGAESRMDIEEELIDRFGDLPEPVTHLTKIAHLRALTRKLFISAVSMKPDAVALRVDEKRVSDPALLLRALEMTDKRLFIARGREPVLLWKTNGLEPDAALQSLIQTLERLLENWDALKAEAAAGET